VIACILGWPLTTGKLPLPRIVAVLAVSLTLYAVLALWVFLLKQLLAKPIPVENAPQPDANAVMSPS
jgi:hypothetical protein